MIWGYHDFWKHPHKWVCTPYGGTRVLRLCHFRKKPLCVLKMDTILFWARSMKPEWTPAWNEVAVCIWPLVLHLAHGDSLLHMMEFFLVSGFHEIHFTIHFLGQQLWNDIFLHEGHSTPWKINMEPTNHPFRKENHLNQTSMTCSSRWSSRVYILQLPQGSIQGLWSLHLLQRWCI